MESPRRPTGTARSPRWRTDEVSPGPRIQPGVAGRLRGGASLSLGAPTARPVDWVFARSLLIEGLRRPAGTGGVLVISRHRCHPHSVRVVLRSSAGAALTDIAESAVAAFVLRTIWLVPPGTESLHIDIDRALAELTGRRD
ncbi:SsgA family sporulation/cell division regulator [Streptomyces sp. NPDC059152]|uniref:SsgA family sporulation/cell division regulator n=1 Tax=Streptomyces sp. NPDC059152 TaxID=3346742 RepID=UPI0036BFD37B